MHAAGLVAFTTVYGKVMNVDGFILRWVRHKAVF